MKSKLIFLIICSCVAFGTNSLKVYAADVAATVGKDTITEDELLKESKEAMQSIERQIYEVKRRTLNVLIEKRLIEVEAKTLNIKPEDVEKQYKAKAKPVTEAEVKAYYEANKGQMQGTYESVKQRVQDFLSMQAQQQTRKQMLQDLRKKHPVKIHLKPMRVNIPVPKDAVAKGPVNAPIQIMFFSDYQCPYCKKGSDTLTQLFENNPGKIRVIYRDHPLPFHSNAKGAAMAARCAGEQNQFWSYSDRLFNNQRALDPASLSKYAAGLALDMKAFDSCIQSNRYAALIESENAEGTKYGVSGTPAFFVNGRMVEGALPIDSFQEIVNEEESINA